MSDLDKLARAYPEAPEGFTHGFINPDGDAEFLEKAFATSGVLPLEFIKASQIRDRYHELLEEEKMKEQPKWNGEGFPPVGAVCGYSINEGANWYKCLIEYDHEQLLVARCHYQSDSELQQALYKESTLFRPLKTDRERIVEKMVGVIGDNWRAVGTHRHVAEALYDSFNITEKATK